MWSNGDSFGLEGTNHEPALFRALGPMPKQRRNG